MEAHANRLTRTSLEQPVRENLGDVLASSVGVVSSWEVSYGWKAGTGVNSTIDSEVQKLKWVKKVA